ncbi:hypothetical protein PH210_23575 [Paenibacillus sp. BSR1-1]|uniref:hypothetical protein n=1 Tax=Paenibacillus sp. BSR1-1 TaxID=3020845 RepID=UPI0025AFF56D|nr:hypothetical protein [Paenibacillus sp. BSR1-1]MDN3019157.1 hypothetical protein [Paenibacillus sp. BSR1-1]
MRLFHYHYWTPQPKEMEDFYSNLGFTVKLRIGKKNGQFETFNPPLTWDDFQPSPPLFRTIEMVLDSINVTFGFGKSSKFDHLGFLVSQEEYESICNNAENLSLKVEEGERRTFIYTPFGFKIELQRRADAVPSLDGRKIRKMVLITGEQEIPHLFQNLLGEIPIEFEPGEETKVKLVELEGLLTMEAADPCGVIIKC